MASEGSVAKNLDPCPLVISDPSLSEESKTNKSLMKVSPNIQANPANK